MKRIFYIFILLVGGFCSTFAQNRPVPAPAKLIRFYPNPAISDINFEFIKGYDKSYSLEVYNFIGKKVLSIKTITPMVTVLLDNFFRGVYIYQLHDRAGKIIESGKFQVIK